MLFLSPSDQVEAHVLDRGMCLIFCTSQVPPRASRQQKCSRGGLACQRPPFGDNPECEPKEEGAKRAFKGRALVWLMGTE